MSATRGWQRRLCRGGNAQCDHARWIGDMFERGHGTRATRRWSTILLVAPAHGTRLQLVGLHDPLPRRVSELASRRCHTEHVTERHGGVPDVGTRRGSRMWRLAVDSVRLRHDQGGRRCAHLHRRGPQRLARRLSSTPSAGISTLGLSTYRCRLFSSGTWLSWRCGGTLGTTSGRGRAPCLCSGRPRRCSLVVRLSLESALVVRVSIFCSFGGGCRMRISRADCDER